MPYFRSTVTIKIHINIIRRNNMPHPNPEINRLLTDIEYYDDLNDPAQMYMKALTLLKLWRAANQGLYEGTILPGDIINTFSRAITLNSTNVLYIAERCQFYVELAMADFKQAKSIPKNPLVDLSFEHSTKTILDGVEKKLKMEMTPISKQTQDGVTQTEKEGITTCTQSSPVQPPSLLTSSPQTMFVAPSVPQSRQKAKIEVLLNRINERTERLQHHPSANGYYQNGDAYMEIAKLTSDTGYILKAIENYTMGVTQFPEDAKNFIARATAYMQLEQVYEAVCDIRSTKTISVESVLDKQYYFNETQNIIQAIKKITEKDATQACLKRLEQDGVISTTDPHWLEALSDHFRSKASFAMKQ